MLTEKQLETCQENLRTLTTHVDNLNRQKVVLGEQLEAINITSNPFNPFAILYRGQINRELKRISKLHDQLIQAIGLHEAMLSISQVDTTIKDANELTENIQIFLMECWQIQRDALAMQGMVHGRQAWFIIILEKLRVICKETFDRVVDDEHTAEKSPA